jgi:polyphosphate kinase 2 (PPK2 family)
VLQALDAAGKDGTIRNVMSGVIRQGEEVLVVRVHPEILDRQKLPRAAKKITKAQRERLAEVKEALEQQALEGAHHDPFEHEQEAAVAAASDGQNGHEADTQIAPPPVPATSE